MGSLNPAFIVDVILKDTPQHITELVTDDAVPHGRDFALNKLLRQDKGTLLNHVLIECLISFVLSGFARDHGFGVLIDDVTSHGIVILHSYTPY